MIRRSPWNPAVTRRTIVVQLVAAIALVLVTLGANRQATVRAQVAWVNAGVVAAIVAGVAQATWLLHARRAVSLRRRQLLLRRARPAVAPIDVAVPAGGTERYRVDGAGWHHAAGCLLVEGKAVEAVVEPHDLRPCVVCAPAGVR